MRRRRRASAAQCRVSVSGTGLHIFGRCDPRQLADRRNKWDGDKEWYHTGRFIALSPHGLTPIGGAWIDKDWTDQLLRLVPRRGDVDGVLSTEHEMGVAHLHGLLRADLAAPLPDPVGVRT